MDENIREEKIQDAITKEINEEQEASNYTVTDESNSNVEDKAESKKKKDFYIEMVLFLLLGILIGIALKTEALKKITIGYEDYKMKISKQDYDINKLQKDTIKKAEAQKQEEDGATSSTSDEKEVPSDNSQAK